MVFDIFIIIIDKITKMNEWLMFSLLTLGVWLIVFIARPDLRKEMWWVSIISAPLGLTQILFVPEYWNPPSLFNLTQTYGFDIESIIWVFSIAGLASVTYELIFKPQHKKSKKKLSKIHYWDFAIIPLVFLIIYLGTDFNPIYAVIIAFFAGGICTLMCRPDLHKQIWGGAAIFTFLYIFFFFILNAFYPNFVPDYWNLSAVSGILFIGIPLEEILFAFGLGMCWGSIYEHVRWVKI